MGYISYSLDRMSTNEMAICLVVFNPAKTKRILMNYYYARSLHERAGLPVFTMELVYEGRTPEIPDAIHVKGNSYMFHKENLYRVLIEKVPPQFKKIAFLDSDIYFNDESWYQQTCQLLNTHTIVQPYEYAYWLDLTYTKRLFRKKTILHLVANEWSFTYHPGFAWCMQREWYEQKGFFDYAITGGGDTLSSAVWLKKDLPSHIRFIPPVINSIYDEYKKTFEDVSITFLKGMTVFHLFHGSLSNRQYIERHKLLNTDMVIQNLTFKNKDGILEWKEPNRWNSLFLKYFQQRNDDELGVDEKEPHT
jgi:hypothetical protein